jgi:cytochrome P450
MKRLDNGQKVPSSACMIPFGGGASYCPGRKFARAEIKTLVAQVLC